MENVSEDRDNDIQTKTSESEIIEMYEKNPYNKEIFFDYINYQIKQNNRENVLNSYNKFIKYKAPSEEIYLRCLNFFKKDEDIYNQIIDRARDDYPFSAQILKNVLIFFDLDVEIFENLKEYYGETSHEIWCLYRQRIDDNKGKSIWKEELNMLLLGWNDAYKEFRELYDEEFTPKHFEELKLFEALNDNLDNQASVINLCTNFKRRSIFEYCITLYPYCSRIWELYFDSYKDNDFFDRAFRFCNNSAKLWIKYIEFNKQFNINTLLSGFGSLESLCECNYLLTYIISKNTDITLQVLDDIGKLSFYQDEKGIMMIYCIKNDIFKNRNLKIERKELLNEMVNRYPNNSYFWLQLIDFEKENGDINDIISAYKAAFNKIKDNEGIIKSWIPFAIFNDCLESINIKDSDNEVTSIADDKNEQNIFPIQEIFVKGIKENTTNDDIKSFFSKIGEISEIKIKKSSASVKFKDKKSAFNAISLLNNKELNGNIVQIYPNKKVKRLLFVAYNTQSSEDGLKSFIKEKTGQTKFFVLQRNGRAFTHIETYNDDTAHEILKLNGVVFMGKPLRIEVLKKK